MPRRAPVRHPGASQESINGWTVAGIVVIVVAIFAFGLPLADRLDARDAADRQATLESELGFEEGFAYPATIVGVRDVQAGISGDFFLASGSFSGLDTVTVLTVSVSIDGQDHIVSVPLSDITFRQIDGMTHPTAALDLRYTPSIDEDTTLKDVLGRSFKGMTIELSPEDYIRLIKEMP